MAFRTPSVAGALVALAAWPAHAQDSAASANPPASAAPVQLAPVVVTANPLGSELFELATPISTLDGQELWLRQQPTLGETLSAQPGISASYFGPNASRPVIRGLDGERIRILQNGVTNLDASGTSVDHAVSLEPLLVDRIEVVRGPAAILYGSSAIGGVVNVIDGRIPVEPLPRGIEGALDARYGSNNEERAGSVRLDLGSGTGLNLHLDGSKRKTDDLQIPGFARSARLRALEPAADEPRGTLANSAASTESAALGTSYAWDKGYIGAAYSGYESDYGTVAEEEVTIRMRQRRTDIAGEVRDLHPLLRAMRFKAARSDYRHTEFEGSEPGTTFKNDGYDARLELVHNAIGGLQGAIGVQSTQFDFSALGEEGFLPRTHSRTHAAFLFEELGTGPVTWQLGARVERPTVEADADERFGPADSRRFTTRSGSLGAVYSFNKAYALALTTSYTERAPNYQELFANGRHLASAAFEVGDRDLGKEKSTAVDLSLRKRSGRTTGSIGVFYNRFTDFIALIPTGAFDSDPDEPLPIFQYQGVPAELMGFEAATTTRLIEAPYRLDLELRADYTRAKNRATGEPLPRISPLRFGGALVWQKAGLGVRLDVLRVQSQDRVAPNELPTDGYTMVDAGVTYTLRQQGWSPELFLRGVNLLDEEARVHTSFLKDIAPLGGRGVVAGVRALF